jgi:EAL domain-containing protein (putative c-di-GMP-specific phosphodiesterase class I)
MSETDFSDEALHELASVASQRSRDALGRILAAGRERLHMEVCTLSQVIDDREVFCAADGDVGSFGIEVGAEWPAAETYGKLVLEGLIASPIPDASIDLRVTGLQLTRKGSVVGYIGAPVTFSGGRVFGVLQCLSHHTAPWLADRDVKFLQVLARLAADEVEREEIATQKERLEADRIRAVLTEGSLSIVFQPIMDLQNGTVVGMEALARFGTEPERSPAIWFAEAGLVGLRTELELLAVGAALAQLESLPRAAYLSVNVSPETVLSPRFDAMLQEHLGGRVVIEIAESSLEHDSGALKKALSELRRRGARVAVDDTRAGFRSLARLHRLLPDIIKLDISLTRDIDKDPVRRSLVSSVLAFAEEIGATVAAEGIETYAEGEAMLAMGVACGQGWFLAEPAPIGEVTKTVDFAEPLSWVEDESQGPVWGR